MSVASPATHAACRAGRTTAYLLVACTELFTHYQLGDHGPEHLPSLVLKDLHNAVIVHDRYQNYDSDQLGELTHQLCCQHLLRDLAGAAEVYPDTHWPTSSPMRCAG